MKIHCAGCAKEILVQPALPKARKSFVWNPSSNRDLLEDSIIAFSPSARKRGIHTEPSNSFLRGPIIAFPQVVKNRANHWFGPKNEGDNPVQYRTSHLRIDDEVFRIRFETRDSQGPNKHGLSGFDTHSGRDLLSYPGRQGSLKLGEVDSEDLRG